MDKEQFINLIKPTLERQTLFQFSQMKAFVDNALKEAVAKNFESEEEKIKYLLESLYSIRDFSLTLTNENSLRLNLMKQFEEIELGNVAELQNKIDQTKTEESLEQDR